MNLQAKYTIFLNGFAFISILYLLQCVLNKYQYIYNPVK